MIISVVVIIIELVNQPQQIEHEDELSHGLDAPMERRNTRTKELLNEKIVHFTYLITYTTIITPPLVPSIPGTSICLFSTSTPFFISRMQTAQFPFI